MDICAAQLPVPPEGADRIVTAPGTVIVLDGASAFGPAPGSPGAYADRLGSELALAVAADADAPLPAILAAAISATASALDLRDGHGPSSTVTIARTREATGTSQGARCVGKPSRRDWGFHD